MTLDSLQGLTMDQINNMSTKEIETALKYGKSILMRRYKNQKKKLGETAPVFKGKNNPYRLKTTKLTRNQAVARLVKTVSLTKAQTTTVTGYKKWKKKNQILTDAKTETSKADLKKIWDFADRIDEINPSLRNIVDYKKILSTITQVVNNHKRVTRDMINKAMRKMLEKEDSSTAYYEQNEWNDI